MFQTALDFSNPTHAAIYLAAYIDGEGSVSPPTARQRKMAINSVDQELIDAVERCFATLGIKYNKYYAHPPSLRDKGWQPQWTVVVCNRDGIEKLAQLPIQSNKKRERLLASVPLYQSQRPHRDELETLYTVKQQSCTEIAEQFGVSKRTVNEWLHHYKIPARPDSEVAKLREAAKAKRPDKQTLVALYHDEKLSEIAIAKRLGVSQGSINNWMKAYGIEKRSRAEAIRLGRYGDAKPNNVAE